MIETAQPGSGCAITLHLGAHKTATTWLQTRLAGSRDYLATLGIAYEPLESFRQGVTDCVLGALHRPAEREALLALADARLAAFTSGPARRFIASDENLIGNPQSIVQTGRLYPWIDQILGMLARTRLRQADRVVLTVRDYATFLPSAYGEAIRWVDFVPFETFRQRLDLKDGMWLRVIENLVGVFGRDRLRVMRFEQMRDRLGDFLAVLADGPVNPDHLAASAEFRQGLSAEAIAALEDIARAEGAGRPRQVIDQVADRFPRGRQDPAYMPWSIVERNELDALYEAHLAEIRLRWPGMLV